MLASSIWPSARERLEKEVSKQQFSTWIQPLTLIESEAGCLRLMAPNRFVMQWVRDRFASRIEVLASELAGVPVQLVVDLASTGPVAVNAAANGEDVDAPTPTTKAGRTSGGRGSLLNSFTFDTFVAGKANQLARAAAIQVAEHPGTSYNPLFIYGGVGLGKTHLIQAVGNAVLAQNPSARVRYLHAAQYISDVIRAYQQKSFDEFKRYYHSLDLLLIDDIQFFASKDRTQEEFFYAFNALVEAQKQVIITSDTYPKDMAGIDERLKSRFSWGLTVAIEPPEQEMRVAIILRKALASGMNLPEEVAFLIAQHVRSNVRELEGALKSVLAFATFSGKAITLETSKEALKDVLSMSNRQISIDNIQKTTADFYKIKIADMHSKKRSRNIARPRQVAMALAKELTMMSLPDIGEAFGNRDHTTVLHACRTIATLRGADQQLNRDFLVLEQILKG
jgi:chromosomal replication initiator protein